MFVPAPIRSIKRKSRETIKISRLDVGLAGFEPATSSMSRMRANQLCHNPGERMTNIDLRRRGGQHFFDPKMLQNVRHAPCI